MTSHTHVHKPCTKECLAQIVTHSLPEWIDHPDLLAILECPNSQEVANSGAPPTPAAQDPRSNCKTFQILLGQYPLPSQHICRGGIGKGMGLPAYIKRATSGSVEPLTHSGFNEASPAIQLLGNSRGVRPIWGISHCCRTVFLLQQKVRSLTTCSRSTQVGTLHLCCICTVCPYSSNWHPTQ